MEIFIADEAGFCFGVKRTMSIAGNAVKEKGIIYSYGPLIHNPQEIERLKEENIIPIDDLDDIPKDLDSKHLIIRSHGVAPDIIKRAEEKGFEVIDATCKLVKKVQILSKELAEAGYQVIIIGDKDHPEVKGIIGWSGQGAIVIENEKEAESLSKYDRIGVLAQTTQTENRFQSIINILKNKTDDLKVYNTICHATEKTQRAAFELAQKVDLMLVVGGKNSSNTNKLTDICISSGIPTYHLESADDLDPGIFKGIKKVGITAGASTPDWIIEEVVLKMTELENNSVQDLKDTGEEVINENIPEPNETEAQAAFDEGPKVDKEEVSENQPPVNNDIAEKEQNGEAHEETKFDDLYGEGIKDVRRGARVKGVIVQVKPDELLVDIGGKSEGIVPAAELLDNEAKDISNHFKVGDEIEVLILKRENQEGYPVLSKRRVDQELLWERFEKARAEGEILTGKVSKVVKGGLLVDLGLRGFIPASLVSMGYVEDLSVYLDKELQVKVIECDKSNNKLVLSAKAVLMEESQKQKEETWATISQGDVRHGIVRRLTKFGAFIDLGGVDGLLHVSEMAWYRVEQPSDLLKEGDEIDVSVLNVDRENEKISLGLKQLIPTPWSTASDKYSQGSIITARVVRLAPFGAFVEVEPGVEGLIHISQLANERVEKTEDVVSPGDEVQVKVLSVDPEAKRISLSIKATLMPPELEQSYSTDEKSSDLDNDIENQEKNGNNTIEDQFENLLNEEVPEETLQKEEVEEETALNEEVKVETE